MSFTIFVKQKSNKIKTLMQKLRISKLEFGSKNLKKLKPWIAKITNTDVLKKVNKERKLYGITKKKKQ